MRHAKSSWDEASLDDFDRPLNDRGRAAAPFMGGLLRRENLVPDIVVSSPARRARETAGLVKDAAGIVPDIRFDDRIYEAAAQTLATVASELDDAVETAMLVGHNPGMEGVIRLLTGELEAMPTAAIAVIHITAERWSDVSKNGGKLEKIYRPKAEMRTAESP